MQKVQRTHVWLLFLLFKHSFKRLHLQPLDIPAYVGQPCNYMDSGWSQQECEKIILAAGKPTRQMPTSAPSLSSCKLTQSMRFFIAGHNSFHSWIVTQVPHLPFSETCWLVLSVNPAFWIHVLFIPHMMSECSFSIMACAFSVTVLPASALEALSVRCKAFILHRNISSTSASLGLPCICIVSFAVHVPLCRVLVKIDFHPVSKSHSDGRNCSYRMHEGFLWKAPEDHWEVFFIALKAFL